ncbi:hypothetical protein NUM3379_10650 [Kineococcus sp. NUM-3379]
MTATATTHPPHRRAAAHGSTCTSAQHPTAPGTTRTSARPDLGAQTQQEVSGMPLVAMLDLAPPEEATRTRTTATDLPCRRFDAELWFAESPADVERAKALCGDCPLRAQCLEGAVARREPWGVWGGELLIAGVVVPRKRPRGRPRKVAA